MIKDFFFGFLLAAFLFGALTAPIYFGLFLFFPEHDFLLRISFVSGLLSSSVSSGLLAALIARKDGTR